MTAADRSRRGDSASSTGAAKPSAEVSSASPSSSDPPPIPHAAGFSFASSVWLWNLLGAALLIASYKPIGIWPLAWIAFVPWLRWVEPVALPRRAYLSLYFAYVVACLGVLYWLTMAHWVAFVGWIALCLYLGVYLPAFIGLCRVAVHRFGVPLIVAAPMLWMGLEYCRCTAMTGFPMGLLCHATTDAVYAIQIADLAGAYLVSGLMIAVAAGIATSLPTERRDFSLAPLTIGSVLLLAALGYGAWRLNEPKSTPSLRVALIQGDRPESVDGDPDEDVPQVLFDMYNDLTLAAVTQRPDLVLWPESIYRFGLVQPAPPNSSPKPTNDEPRWTDAELSGIVAAKTAEIQRMVDAWQTPGLIGGDVYEMTRYGFKRYNSAALVSPEHGVVGTYAKVHLVPFGEYIPLGETYPWIYQYTPLGGGLAFGREGQTVLELPRRGKPTVRLAPSICFETTVPHRTRAQFVAARAAGTPPDVIANVTNDGWFHGSAELDVHLACGVYRAIEMRTPLVIAANTGLSANVDADGRILWQSERMKALWHIADVAFDSRDSLYLSIGDWPVAICLALGCVLAVVGLWPRRRVSAA